MPEVKKFLDSVTGEVHDSARLVQAIELIEDMNVAMQRAAGALSCLKDIDFHGKWRIRTALLALSMRDEARADQILGAGIKPPKRRKKRT